MIHSLNPFKYHELIWKIGGMWPWRGQPRWYYLYCAIFGVSLYGVFPVIMLINLFTAKDIYQLIETIYFLPTACLGVKIVLLLKNRSYIEQVLNLTERMHSQIMDEKYKIIIRKSEREVHLLTRLLSSTFLFASVVTYIDAQTANYDKMMWSLRLPFRINDSKILYQIILNFEMAMTLCACVILASLDCFGPTIYKLLGAHLDIIGQRLLVLGNENRPDAMNSTENKQRLPEKTEWLRQNEAELIKCVQSHYDCIELCDYANIITSDYCIIQFAMSGVVLCGSNFQISVLDPINEFATFLGAIMYIISMFVQLFIPCYCASQLTNKSDKLSSYVYNSNWIEQSKSYKTSMIIFVERNFQPIIPKAGGLFDIGLPIFVSVVKLGYSMFAFMKDLE